MYRMIRLVLAIALVAAVAAAPAAAGEKRAMSPIGSWTVSYEDDASPADDNITLQALHSGGTLSGAAWSDATTNTVGSWEKTRGNRFASTFYIMIPPNGYVKVVQEFWMVGKNEMRGREEGWFVVGQDPLAAPAALLWTGDLTFRRVPAEAKQVP